MTRADFILILILIVVSVIGWFVGSQYSIGDSIRITVANFPDKTVELRPSNQVIRVTGKLGVSIIEINSSGRARFIESPCPNKLCINSGWVSPPFGTACLPNGVLLEFIQSNSQFDGVTH